MMRQQNKNRFIRLSALLVLILVLSFTLMACAPETPDTGDGNTDPVTETVLPIKNGNFEYTTGTNYPKTPKNWTFSTGYTLDSDDDVHVYNGVIKVTDDAYTLYSDKYHTQANPGQNGTDGYVLMINNVNKYSAGYTSDTITFEKGKYYQVTVYVKTALDSENQSGAFITLENDSNSRTYASFEKVVASDWTSYSFWVEASKSASNTAKLSLANGDGGKTSDNLSKGAVFFDSVALTEKTEEEYNAAVKNSTTAKYTFALRNADFTETSSATVAEKPVTPYDWTSYVGRDDNGSSIAPTLGLTRGIIDVDTYTPSVGVLAEKEGDNFKYDITKPTNSEDNNVLMIYLSKPESPSAYSYYSNSITFEYDNFYKLSFSVRTVGIKDVDGKEFISDDPNNPVQKGVTVKLGEDNVLIENVNTKGEWKTYEVYVRGSETQSKNLSLYFWLGQGHANDKANFVSGAAFFDSVKLEKLANYSISDFESQVGTKVNLSSTNILTTSDFFTIGVDSKADAWTEKWADDHGDDTTRDGKIYSIDLNDYDFLAEAHSLTASNPGTATINRADKNKAILLQNKTENAFSALYNGSIVINKNISYRLSFWVKTDGIKKGSGANIALLDKNDEDSTLSTLSAINTQSFDEDGAVSGNEWKEVVFYIQGNQLENKNITLKLSLVSGNMYNPAYLSGSVFVSNFYLEKIAYKEYTASSSSSYTAKYSFRGTESVSVANGNFNNIDIDKSEISSIGELTKPGAVQNWTGSYTSADVDATNVNAGIVTKTLYDNLDASIKDLANPFEYSNTNPAPVYNGAPNVLMVYTNTSAYGFTSNSTSLTAKAYYKISVNVKTSGTNTAKVTLYNGDVVTHIELSKVTDNDGWTTATFFVKVGLNSSNMKLRLETVTDNASAVTYFDNAISETASADEFKDAVVSATTKKIDLNVESFANETTDYPATPSNYKGAVIGKAPSSDSDVASGVLSKDHMDLEIEESFGLTASDITTPNNSGSNVLVIYNKNDSAYKYTSNTYSFSADTYYKVTVWAKTKSLGEGDNAKITLTLSDTANAVFTLTDTEWKDYTFYVKMDESALSNVTIALSLGEYNLDNDKEVITADYAKGYAFFDDISIEDIDEATYTAGINGITDQTTNVKKIDVVAINIENEAEEEEEDPDGSLTGADGMGAVEIITIVSASLLSLALVAVLVVVFVKKIAPRMKEKKNKRYKKPSYDKRTSEVASKDKLDKFKD